MKRFLEQFVRLLTGSSESNNCEPAEGLEVQTQIKAGRNGADDANGGVDPQPHA